MSSSAMSQRSPRRVLSLRATLLFALGLTLAFVATVGLGLVLRVVPRAAQLAERSARAQQDFEARTRLAAELSKSIIDLGEQVRLERKVPLAVDSLRIRRERLEELIRSSSLLSPLERPAEFNATISASLEAADLAAARVAGELLGVVGWLEVHDVANAEQVLRQAVVLGAPLAETMSAVTTAALAELNLQERRLTREANLAAQFVGLWLGVGAILLSLLWWVLQRRLFGPLTTIDRSLTRIESGDFTIDLEVRTDDEMGRLEQHFNRTTQVLREQRATAERAAAVEAQEASDARYRSAFEQAAVGLSEISLEGRFLRLNGAMCGILGRTEAEVLGHHFEEFTHPDDVTADRDRFPRVADGRVNFQRLEKRYVRADGSIATVQITGTLLRDTDGTPRHVLSVVQDVTEQRRLEVELFQSKKLDAVGQLAGGVAHDFNNLLTGIIGYADLLEHDAANSPEVRDDAAAIRQTALRGADLSRSLLALARRTPLKQEPFALDTILRETADLVRRTFDRRIELELQLEVIATIAGDRSLVSNALLNLALNARDAMPDGGTLAIRARVETPAAGFRMRHGLMSTGPHAVITVGDTGTGMPPAVIEHLFEPFFTTKSPGKGTGLGLAMVYGTVKDHGGAILVESVVGRGTTFTVFLPCSDIAGTVPVVATAPISATTNACVLIVDDEDLVRDVATRMLRRLGYRVEQAVDGLAAIDRLALDDHGIDVVLMDGNMPRLNGVEAARRLHQRHPRLPMIYASGFFQPGWSEDLTELGFREHLTKPYSMEALSKAISRCLTAPATAGRRQPSAPPRT